MRVRARDLRVLCLLGLLAVCHSSAASGGQAPDSDEQPPGAAQSLWEDECAAAWEELYSRPAELRNSRDWIYRAARANECLGRYADALRQYQAYTRIAGESPELAEAILRVRFGIKEREDRERRRLEREQERRLREYQERLEDLEERIRTAESQIAHGCGRGLVECVEGVEAWASREEAACKRMKQKSAQVGCVKGTKNAMRDWKIGCNEARKVCVSNNQGARDAYLAELAELKAEAP